MESLFAALSGDFLGTPVYFWVAFISIVIGLLVFDLGILHRDEHEIEAEESLLLYGFYVLIALGFGAWSTSEAVRIEQGLATPWVGVKERIFWYGYQSWFIVLALTMLVRQSVPASRPSFKTREGEAA